MEPRSRAMAGLLIGVNGLSNAVRRIGLIGGGQYRRAGLDISQFNGDGIDVTGSHERIQQNTIGVDPTGTVAGRGMPASILQLIRITRLAATSSRQPSAGIEITSGNARAIVQGISLARTRPSAMREKPGAWPGSREKETPAAVRANNGAGRRHGLAAW